MEQMDVTVTAIIVTHNSELYIRKCIEDLKSQSYPTNEIIIVDSGSTDTSYLKNLHHLDEVKVIYADNIGFSAGNNKGFGERTCQSDFVIFLNPDTFLENEVIEKAIHKMKADPLIGALSGRLIGYDIKNMVSSGLLDSAGIFRKKYGRWYDRGRNSQDIGQFMKEEEVPALCGALLFCRNKALESLGKYVFDQDFFLYKEDIEISLRMRKNGWKLVYSPDLKAFHCRGWKGRSQIPYTLKKAAVESEILLYKKHPSPYIVWAYFKYWLVILLRI